MPNRSTLINQYSTEVRYVTPPPIIDAARFVLGQIDVDIASSEAANKVVGARKFFTEPEYSDLNDPGYNLPLRTYWHKGGLEYIPDGDTVWLNRPFGSTQKACTPGCKKTRCMKRGWHSSTDLPGDKEWISWLINNYKQGNITAAMTITFASTSESWFQPFFDHMISFVSPRVSYLDENLKVLKGTPRGSCLIYLGNDHRHFTHAFDGKIGNSIYKGRVMFPANYFHG